MLENPRQTLIEVTSPFSGKLEEISQEWLTSNPGTSAILVKNQKRYLAAMERVVACESPLECDFLDWGCGFPVLTAMAQGQMRCAVAFEPFATEVQEDFARHYGFQIQRELSTEATFDVITMIEVIEHLPVLQDVIPEVVRRLKRNGRLIVTTPNGTQFAQWIEYVRLRRAHPMSLEKFLLNTNTYEHHTREFTLQELGRTLEYFGLNVEELAWTDISPSFEDRVKHATILSLDPPHKPRFLKNMLGKALKAWRPSLICVARRP